MNGSATIFGRSNPGTVAQRLVEAREATGLTTAQLAHRLGEDRSTVANFLRLLELAEPVRAMIRDGRVTLGHAKVLAGVADILEQEESLVAPTDQARRGRVQWAVAASVNTSRSRLSSRGRIVSRPSEGRRRMARVTPAPA